MSGTVSAAENGLPIPRVLVQIVDGVNAGRSVLSDNGAYQLADLEPGSFTLLFTTSEYRDLQRTEVVQANTTLNVQLERKGLTLSGRITTQWGEPINDAGVEARSDGGARGGGTSNEGDGVYRIPTLPLGSYNVRVFKWGYDTPERTLTITGDTRLDFALNRVRVLLFGTVSEAPPCSGRVAGAEVDAAAEADRRLARDVCPSSFIVRENLRRPAGALGAVSGVRGRALRGVPSEKPATLLGLRSHAPKASLSASRPATCRRS